MDEIRLKHYNGDVPKYCWKCGGTLLRETFCSGFDSITGVKVYQTDLKCPRVFPHVKYEYDSKGNEILHRY